MRPGRNECKECHNRRKRERRAERPTPTEKYRQYRLKWAYGITPADYDRMLRAQGGVCGICKRPSEFGLRVDHCHTTGRVRGLLCTQCNPGVGYFDDDPARLRAAAAYLEQGELR
jgi:Recombination endonuclease VII